MNTNGKLIALVAAFVLPPTLLLAQTNNARYLGDTIPTTMIPGFSYSVSLMMKNTGTTTWTKAEDYYLGAVGDSDPFAPGRIALADSDSIWPGQDKTFSFTMIAPSAGVYTTDWRMLRENVEWFGDTLTRQVNVTFGPTPPGAPTILWPTPGMVLGSNRPDIRFQGDPSDGYEVHIGSCNVPASNDGWDSGFVSLNPGPDPISVMSGVLNVQAYYHVFARLHNTNGWGPWTAHGNWFYTDGQLMNDPYFVAGEDGGQRGHRMCYNPDRNEYLVGYFDAKTNQRSVVSYYRLDGTGTRIGSEVSVVDDLEGDGGPTMCYNSAQKEYLIAYGGYTSSGGLHTELHLQRVNAATGALIGGSMRVNTPNPTRNNIAYSPRSDRYLLAIEDSGQILGLMLDSMAVPVGSIFPISNGTYVYSGTPRICYNSTDDEFFVPWVVNTNVTWDAYAQRVRASDGALMGSNITIGDTAVTEFPGGVAYDSDMNRYLIICDGEPSSPWVQFMSASGTLIGSRIPIGGGYYQGGMSGIAWNSATKEFLATWGHCCTSANFARRISETAEPLGEPFRTNGYVQGFGNWDPLPVANTATGEFLIAWYWQYDNVYVRRYKACPLPPPDTQRPGPVSNLTLSRSPAGMNLSWTNPATADFSATMIRVKASSPPVGPNDGRLIADKPNCPGTADTLIDPAEPKGTLLCYAAFARDLAGNYADAATAWGMLVAGDFDGDDDVDQEDFGHLQACLSGSGVSYAPGCKDADFDADADIDQDDFGVFQACVGGANQPPGC